MRVINLASGSDGNLTYIESENCKLLLDMGLSCAETIKRLKLININPEDIHAILISHEHFDHIKGVDVFSKKYNTPVYAHHEVYKGLNQRFLKVSQENRKPFDGQSFTLQDILITPIALPHDVPCFGFSFENDKKKISILTDLGHTNDRILNSIQGSQIVYLESNYDKYLLSKNEHYPLMLKRRIAGPFGHLSNIESAKLIAKLVVSGTRQIVLAHLSKDNNSPEVAFKSVVDQLYSLGIIEGFHVRIDVATDKPGVMFKLS